MVSTMLSAAEDNFNSPLDLPPLNNASSSSSASSSTSVTLPGLNGDIDLHLSSPTVERRVAESVSQELDYWEKLVFSFDMERDPGRPGGHQQQQQSDAGSSSRSTASKRRTADQAQAPGAPTPSGSNPSQTHGQHSLASRHGLSFPPIAPNPHPHIPAQLPPNIPAAQLNQLAGLDPYTLAHLAALSAIQQGQQPSTNPQSLNFQDPSAVLRQYQSLLYPYGGTGQASPGRGSPIQGVGQSSSPPQLQRFPSTGFSSRSGTQHGPHQPMQPSLSESSSTRQQQQQQQQHRWSPQVPSMGPLPFPMPPIDPSLVNQLSQLSQSMFPGTFGQSAQTSGAGPSSASAAGAVSRGRSRSMTSTGTASSTPVSPAGSFGRAQTFVEEVAMTEDKRRRNTLASARFRIKKKHKTLALERSVVELEARAEDLEREASELRRENGWLKEMLIMKGRSVRAQAAVLKAQLEASDGEEEEEEGEEGEEEEGEDEELGSGEEFQHHHHERRSNDGDEKEGGGGGLPGVKGKGKGKGKEKAT